MLHLSASLEGCSHQKQTPRNLDQTLVWVSQPPELWKNQFLLSPPSTAFWYINLSKLREVLRATGIPRQVMGPAHWTQPATCSYMACGLRMVFTLLNGGEKIKRRITFCDMWKWYQIQISMSINEALMEHSHTHFYVLCIDDPFHILTEDSRPIVWPWK